MAEKEKSNKKRKGSNFLIKILLKVLFSPLLIFLIGFFYLDQDVRKGLLVALYAYTAITTLSVLSKVLGVLFSAVKLNVFKAVFKSISIVFMLITLIFYWFLYSLFFGANFSL